VPARLARVPQWQTGYPPGVSGSFLPQVCAMVPTPTSGTEQTLPRGARAISLNPKPTVIYVNFVVNPFMQSRPNEKNLAHD
jgi:hypothetical protein